jgi:hypothetical protein
MYKLCPLNIRNEQDQVKRLSDNAYIPFDPANGDYQRFKKEIRGIGEMGESITPAELQDAEGNTMTTEEVEEFVATLP